MKRSILFCSVLAGLSFGDLNSMRARVPEIASLKDRGAIGEMANGYLGVVKPEGNAQAIVDAENADRKEEYQKRAASQGQTLENFAAVLGEAKIRQEKNGRFIKGSDGQWKKK